MKLAYIYNSDDLHKLYVFDEFIDKVLAMPIVIKHSDLKYSKNLSQKELESGDYEIGVTLYFQDLSIELSMYISQQEEPEFVYNYVIKYKLNDGTERQSRDYSHYFNTYKKELIASLNMVRYNEDAAAELRKTIKTICNTLEE